MNKNKVHFDEGQKIDKLFVQDFVTIVSVSPLLSEAYEGLSHSERHAVNTRFVEWCWQMVIGKVGEYTHMSARAFGKTVRQFSGFILATKSGQNVEFHASTWVAMDRKTYEELKRSK